MAETLRLDTYLKQLRLPTFVHHLQTSGDRNPCFE